MDAEKTKVVFRMWRRGNKTCIALFPEIDAGHGYCEAFEHVGQHGGAEYAGCIRRTRQAKPAEYADLAKELAGRGYNLKIIQCRTR